MSSKKLSGFNADLSVQENILVNENSTAALCDFGLSVAVDDTPSDFSGSSLGAGSIRYMAPERFDPDFKPTTAIDVYALGCVCMEVRGPRLLTWQVYSTIFC